MRLILVESSALGSDYLLGVRNAGRGTANPSQFLKLSWLGCLRPVGSLAIFVEFVYLHLAPRA